MRQSRVSKQSVVVVAVCAALMIAELCPSAVVAARYVAISPRSKPRSTRGFKSDTLNIARSFGKRGSAGDMPAFMGDSLTVARNYGKRTPGFAVTAGRFSDISQHSSEVPFAGDNLDGTIGEAFADKLTDSFPLDWFVEEMQNNPDLARTVLHKFVDANGDGYLSADELLRPVVF